MSLDVMLLLHVGGNETRHSCLSAAWAQAFPSPRGRVVACASVEQALRGDPDEAHPLVVLSTAEAAEVEQVLTATDRTGLPRCAVVWVSTAAKAPLGVEVLAPDELSDVRLVARALRSSVAQWRLRREWARERGDVWTMGRRLTHDLRNPLGCVVTTAEMLKEVLQDEAPQHVTFVDSLVDASAEMLALLNRLHFVAKASAQPAPPADLDMVGCYQAAIDRLQREITQRHARLSAPEEWPTVRGVRPWLEAIWWNLLANALRHGGDTGVIEAGWRRETDHWLFWVADEGPGVPPERVSQLFTPFNNLHQRHGGGLGLSIAHRLVELQHGRCRYERRPGGGSVFSFTLPDPPDPPPSLASRVEPTALLHARRDVSVVRDAATLAPTPAV